MALCVFTLGLSACEDSGTESVQCGQTELQAVMDAVNQERQANGLGILRVDVRLVDAAQGHAQNMADSLFVGHTGSDGSTAVDRVSAEGYTPTTVLEVVAAGPGTGEDIVAGWLAEPTQAQFLRSPAVQHIGVGRAEGGTGSSGTCWCVVLAATEGAIQTTPDGCHPSP
ncbi:MAG: CAP domain-containing protein [bacterium]